LGSGPITLSDGTLTWSGTNVSDVSSQLQIGTGGGTLDTNGNDVSLANGFGGSGPVTKTGAGTLTLNAANGSYGNQLVVHQGTVLVPAGKSVTTPVEIASGGTLNCDGGTLGGGVTNQGGTADGAPGAPTNVGASAGFENATLSFTPGVANCYPLSYTVSGGGLSWSVNSSPATLSGLTANHAYTFTLTATNPIGSASAGSNTITAEPYDPSVSIGSPANGAAYRYGQTVDAGYGCQDGTGGPGVSSCTGTISSGVAVNTKAPGRHTFTVTATSLDGLRTSATVTYTVLAPPNSFKIKSVRANRKGTITVSLSSLREPGIVTVTERATKVPQFIVRKHVRSEPTLKFTVPASKRLRALLKHHGVTVRLTIAYTPTNGVTRDLVTSTRLK
jgi:autotransporter-associated beta strand protein